MGRKSKRAGSRPTAPDAALLELLLRECLMGQGPGGVNEKKEKRGRKREKQEGKGKEEAEKEPGEREPEREGGREGETRGTGGAGGNFGAQAAHESDRKTEGAKKTKVVAHGRAAAAAMRAKGREGLGGWGEESDGVDGRKEKESISRCASG